MDRNSILGYVLIFVIFMAWIFYASNKSEMERMEQEQEQARLDSIADVARQDSIEHAKAHPVETAEAETTIAATEVVDSNATQEAETVTVPDVPEEFFSLKNDKINVTLTSKGGSVHSVELLTYKRSDSTDLVLVEPGKNRFSFQLPLRTGAINSEDLDFTVKTTTKDRVILEHKFAGGGSIEQDYHVGEGYILDYDIRFIDLEEKLARKANTLPLQWSMELVQQERTLDNERGASTLYYKYATEKGVESLSARSNDDDELQAGVQWISFKQQFFMSTLIFPEGLEESGTAVSVVKDEEETNIAYMTGEFDIPYSFASVDEHSMQFYYGPNHYQTLKKLKLGMHRTIELGGWPINLVNKYVVIPIFNWLSKYISSYGVIILLLTLFIKLVLIFPMYKSYLSTAKMRILKPEIDKIKENAGGDMAKMQQEQMKLYKKVGVSPLGGCLPQLVQFPILIALFRFFPSSIELRQKALWWASDLSTYDDPIKFGFDIPLIGDHLSLFTLLMAASSMLYTIYNQQATGGVNNQMKFIMYLMPIMLLFWFNSYAAGLSYYYFLANMITFGQNFIFSKFIVDEDKIKRQMEANKNKKVKVKKSRFQKKLEEAAKKRGVDPKQFNR